MPRSGPLCVGIAYDIVNGYGGIETLLLNLIRSVDRARCRIVFCTFPWIEGRIHAGLDAQLKLLGVPRLSLPPFSEPIRLRSALRRAEVDVVDIHTPHPTSFTGYIAAFRLAGVSVVRTSHNVLPGPGKIPDEGWRAQLADLLTARVVVGSATDAEIHRSRLGREPPFCTVVPCGIDVERFRPGLEMNAARVALGLPREVPVVGLFGRLVEQKGQDTFVSAMPQILDRYPKTRFVLVGGGDDEPKLRDQVARSGLTQQVMFAGLQLDPVPWYAACDVIAMPSRWETFGLVAAEAMSTGKALVASDLPIMREVVGSGGLLVAPEDPKALAEGIASLLGDPERRALLGARGRAQVVQRFSQSASNDLRLAVWERASGRA